MYILDKLDADVRVVDQMCAQYLETTIHVRIKTDDEIPLDYTRYI